MTVNTLTAAIVTGALACALPDYGALEFLVIVVVFPCVRVVLDEVIG